MTIPEPKQLAAYATMLAGLILMAVGLARGPDMAMVSASSALLGGPAIVVSKTTGDSDAEPPEPTPPPDTQPETPAAPIQENPVPAQRDPMDQDDWDEDF